jgi:type I restriction enzyme S subunit
VSEFPQGWAATQVGDITQPIRGVTYRKAEARADAGEDYLPILRATNVSAGGLVLDCDLVYVPRARVRPEQMLAVGDVLVASSSGSSAVVGKSALLREAWHGAFGAFCLVLRPNDQVDPKYVALWVASEPVRRRWSQLAAGTNINNLKRGDIAETVVALPPLAEQRRIVAAIEEQFSRLDAATSAVVDTRRRLDALTRGILDTTFSNQSTAQPLGGFLREPLRNGHSAKASRDGTGVRTLTLTAVTRGEFVDAHTKLAAADPSRIGDLWLTSGDVLIERSNTPELVGTAALYRGPDRWAIFPDLLIRVRTTDELVPDYLAFFLRSSRARNYFKARAQGIAGSMPKIDQRAVAELPTPAPPPEEQRRIVAEIARQLSLIDALGAAVESAQKRSAALRRAILERAFRGELVPQDPDDEPASVLLERIRAERELAPGRTASGRRQVQEVPSKDRKEARNRG